MTVARFPVTIRLSVADDRVNDPGLPILVVDAAGAALRRAVETAGQLHIVREGRSEADPRAQVTVRLTGDALPEDVAIRLRNALAGLAQVEAARLLARPPGSRSSQPGAQQTIGPADTTGRGEAFAAERLVVDYDAVEGDRYLIPSYGGKGKPTRIPVKDAGPKAGDQGDKPVRLVRHLRQFRSASELNAALRARYRGDVPEILVIIAAKDDGSPGAWLARTLNGDVVRSIWIGPFQQYVSTSGEGDAEIQTLLNLPGDMLRYSGEGATRAERLRMREQNVVRIVLALGRGYVTPQQARGLARAKVKRIQDRGPVRYFDLYSGATLIQRFEMPTEWSKQDYPVAEFSVTTLESEQEKEWQSCGALPDPPSDSDVDADHPFMGEPPTESWPPSIALNLAALVDNVAGPLHMRSGRFPGMFAMAATQRIRREAIRLGYLPGTGKGGVSPRFAEISRMAGSYAAIHRLVREYTRMIGDAAEAGILDCPIRGQSSRWLRHFWEEFNPRVDESIAALFVATCQDALLENLEESYAGILGRLANFNGYMKVTRAMIMLLLVDTVELMTLRAKLVTTMGPTWGSLATGAGVAVAVGPIGAWVESTRLLTAALAQPAVDTTGPTVKGRIIASKDGPRIQDSTGRWWSRGELDAVVSTGRQQAFALDPLLEKLSNLPDTVERLRAAGIDGIDDEFKSILSTMKNENETRTPDVRKDPEIAFGLASMREAERTNWGSIGAELSGVHKIADERLRPLFTGEGEVQYVAGMQTLVSTELGKAAFERFFGIVGITAIALFCPPAAFAIGAVQAIAGLEEAFEHRGIQRAMLGGDEILSRAQVEAELWGAAIGAALAFVPAVPGVMKTVRGGAVAVAKGEARQAAGAAGRQLASRSATHIAELAAKNLLEAYIKECLVGYVLTLAIESAIGRITDQVAKEVQVGADTKFENLPGILSRAFGGAV